MVLAAAASVLLPQWLRGLPVRWILPLLMLLLTLKLLRRILADETEHPDGAAIGAVPPAVPPNNLPAVQLTTLLLLGGREEEEALLRLRLSQQLTLVRPDHAHGADSKLQLQDLGPDEATFAPMQPPL